MDVHKDSIRMAVLQGNERSTVYEGTYENDIPKIIRRLRSFAKCEVGDYRRFPSAGSFMSYLGLVPSEHSSGAKRYQGGITKTGNSHLRKLLIESSWHYRYYTTANFGSILATRLRPSPMIRLSCGIQSAHIRLINCRTIVPLLIALLSGG